MGKNYVIKTIRTSVVKTDEELEIANECVRVLKQ